MDGSPHASAPVLAAYRYCEAVTGHQARNFAYGIRLLPTEKRHAMSALYAFSRRIDDIGDGALPADAKRARLNRDPRSARPDPRRRDRGGRHRPGGRRAHPRRPALPDPARRARRADRRRAEGRGRGDVRDLGRPQGLLPLCGGRHRAALPRRVRHRTRRARCLSRPRIRRYARPRTATDQHPARRPRGRRDAGAPICPPTTSPSSAAPRPSTPRSPRPTPTSPGWCSSRSGAPGRSSPRATGCCRCWTGAAGRAWPPWRASTADSWSGSPHDPAAVLRGRVSLPGHEKAYVAVRGLAGLDTRAAVRRGAGGIR